VQPLIKKVQASVCLLYGFKNELHCYIFLCSPYFKIKISFIWSPLSKRCRNILIYICVFKAVNFQKQHSICHTNFTCSPTPYLRGVFILEDKCADIEDLNNMQTLFQNIKTKSDVAP